MAEPLIPAMRCRSLPRFVPHLSVDVFLHRGLPSLSPLETPSSYPCELLTAVMKEACSCLLGIVNLPITLIGKSKALSGRSVPDDGESFSLFSEPTFPFFVPEYDTLFDTEHEWLAEMDMEDRSIEERGSVITKMLKTVPECDLSLILASLCALSLALL